MFLIEHFSYPIDWVDKKLKIMKNDIKQILESNKDKSKEKLTDQIIDHISFNLKNDFEFIITTNINWKSGIIFSNLHIENLFDNFSNLMFLKYLKKQKTNGDSWFDFNQKEQISKFLRLKLELHIKKEDWLDCGIFSLMLYFLQNKNEVDLYLPENIRKERGYDIEVFTSETKTNPL